MKEENKKSKCCNAPVKVEGIDGVTYYYVCTKCGEPCDIKEDDKD